MRAENLQTFIQEMVRQQQRNRQKLDPLVEESQAKNHMVPTPPTRQWLKA